MQALGQLNISPVLSTWHGMSKDSPSGMTVETVSSEPQPPQEYRPSFVVNTVWTWTSVAVSVATAILVPPLLIRRLGDDAYGMWALIFSTVEVLHAA